MVNFAELKAKAEKAKDASVAKVTNTRDRMTSMPSSKINWDSNRKRGSVGLPSPSPSPLASTSAPPPPPPRTRPNSTASAAGAAVPRGSRPADADDVPVPPGYTPRPPPTRVTSGYPTSHRETVDRIDWVNLSAADKVAFFGWLDEFFSRYLGIQVGPGKQGRASPSSSSWSVTTDGAPASTFAVYQAQAAQHAITRPPPAVNTATRPQM